MVLYLGDDVPKRFDPKDPSDVDVFRFDYRNRIGVATITTRAVEVDAGITNDGDALALTDQAVDVTLSGGTLGRDYRVRVRATLSDGRVLDATGIVPVRHR